jgi:hypothetical protein
MMEPSRWEVVVVWRGGGAERVEVDEKRRVVSFEGVRRWRALGRKREVDMAAGVVVDAAMRWW